MKNKILICLIVLITILIGLAFLPKEEPVSYKIMTTQQAKERFQKPGNYIILDVRTKEEYETGYIGQAINIPLDEIDESVYQKLPDLNQEIYVYCRSGNRSVTASKKLAKLGYTNIVEFGGIINW